MSTASIFMTPIPYRSTSSLTTDLVGGTLDSAIISLTATAPFIQSAHHAAGHRLGRARAQPARAGGIPDAQGWVKFANMED